MKCLSCNEETLEAKIQIEKFAPLAARGGGIKVGGIKVNQFDLRDVWEGQQIRGPIFCMSCGEEHYYVAKAKDPLRRGSTEEAKQRGYDAVLTERS